MRKRYCSFLFVVLLLASLGLNVYSVGAPAVEMERIDGQTDDHFSVVVKLKNSPGIWGGDFTVNYDKTALILEKVENGDFFSPDEWTKGYLESENYILSFQNTALDENNTTEDGTLATMFFSVRKDAPNGTSVISINHEPGDVINIDLEDINFSPAEIIIHVGNHDDIQNPSAAAQLPVGNPANPQNKDLEPAASGEDNASIDSHESRESAAVTSSGEEQKTSTAPLLTYGAIPVAILLALGFLIIRKKHKGVKK